MNQSCNLLNVFLISWFMVFYRFKDVFSFESVSVFDVFCPIFPILINNNLQFLGGIWYLCQIEMFLSSFCPPHRRATLLSRRPNLNPLTTWMMNIICPCLASQLKWFSILILTFLAFSYSNLWFDSLVNWQCHFWRSFLQIHIEKGGWTSPTFSWVLWPLLWPFFSKKGKYLHIW